MASGRRELPTSTCSTRDLQVAGVIGTDGGPWANDTTGGFFFDATGQLPNNESVQPIYNATSIADVAAWPGAACVPQAATDSAAASVFDLLLQVDSTTGATGGGSGIPYCRRSASQGDIWFMSWEGNPSLTAGRKHPLGIAVESRGMGWNFPSGNEDILYFIYTFYNVTSTNAADYTGIRQPVKDILLGLAGRFQVENAARGSTLPTGGYTITNMFAAFAADMDVSEASSNYSSVNLPFALGYVYEESFAGAQGWLFDPSIFGSPFFPGAGFVGVKYLKSPTGPGAIQLFSNTANTPLPPGAIGDPRDIKQLYRYLSGNLSTAAGDAQCSVPGTPSLTHVCYVNVASPGDMRFFQSSTGLTLAPGKAGSIVVAYIFAAPVKTGLCPSLTCANVKPAPTAADVLRLTNANLLAQGANPVDSITGYRGYSDLVANGGNGDNIVQQNEFRVVPGSLLGKANVAQQVFDNKFLLPFAPDPPPFFLIPGSNEVTVIWSPSPTENSGDPFFQIANAAQVIDPQSGLLVSNSLYDPNYRFLDVEGYRVYRGRIDAPNELTLLAQFDYTGTFMSDYTGVVMPTSTCAPEANLLAGCPAAYPAGGNQKNGTTLTVHTDYDLTDLDPALGEFVQLTVTGASKGRQLLATNEMVTLKADTAVKGGGTNGGCGPKSACPALTNTGIPFSYVDRTPKNGFRYFYSVTAFDVNSFESGPSSLESPRNTKSTTPVRPAGNFVNTADLSLHVVGRGVAMDTIITADPTINAITGVFSGPQRPANGMIPGFVGQLAKQVLSGSGGFEVRLDSISATGEGDESGCCGGVAAGSPVTYYFTAQSGALISHIEVPITPDGNDSENQAAGEAFFSATNVDATASQRFGGDSTFELKGTAADTIPSFYYYAAPGLGCRIKSAAGGIFAAGANDCIYGGPRWFNGPTTPTSSPLPADRILPETTADPTSGNCNHNGGNGPVCAAVSFNNAGALTGVTTVLVPESYTQLIRRWRNMESSFAPYARAADMNVYWGAAGRIDSVIDVTHNVPIPDAYIRDGAGGTVSGVRPLGANWGVINTAKTNFASTSADGRPAVLTATDLPCFEPYRSIHVSPQTNQADGFMCAVTGATPYAPGQPFTPDTVVTPGQVAFFKDTRGNAAAAAVAPGAGFGLYVSGIYTMFELTGGAVPAAGTVWTLRNYSGVVNGGNGVGGGSKGPYSFTQTLRPFTAVGASAQVAFTVVNNARGPTLADLKRVHTVPDPYYVTNAFEQSTDNKIIKFVNLPSKAIIRIYSSSGVLVNILEHNSVSFGGEENWNVRNRNNQVVASGVYFYHIEANDAGKTARRVGRMTIVNFAQ